MYTLGIREAYMAKEQGCTCEPKITSDDLTYWSEDSNDAIRPKIPTILTYEKKHGSTPHLPYCIYALVHDSYVKASSLTDKDKKKFNVDFVKNGKIIQKCWKRKKQRQQSYRRN